MSAKVTRLDDWRHSYDGWMTLDGYTVTDPRRDVVDVYEAGTWRKLGSHALSPSLRVGTGPLMRLHRWHEAIKALQLKPAGPKRTRGRRRSGRCGGWRVREAREAAARAAFEAAFEAAQRRRGRRAGERTESGEDQARLLAEAALPREA